MSLGKRQFQRDGTRSTGSLIQPLSLQDLQVTVTQVAARNASKSTMTTLVFTATTTYTLPENKTSPTSIPAISPFPSLQDGYSQQNDSIIVSSVLGGITIFLISALAIAFCLYKHRKRRRELDYSPPFTSLAPPPRSVLSPQNTADSPISPIEPHETSLSMGPSFYNSTHISHPLHQHPLEITQMQQQRHRPPPPPPPPLDQASITTYNNSTQNLAPNQSVVLPPIAIQLSNTPPPTAPRQSGRQSQLYHDALREENEYDAARRRGLDVAVPVSTTQRERSRRRERPGRRERPAYRERPAQREKPAQRERPVPGERPGSALSGISISDIETGQVGQWVQVKRQASGENMERGRGAAGFPSSTRASSGVFADD